MDSGTYKRKYCICSDLALTLQSLANQGEDRAIEQEPEPMNPQLLAFCHFLATGPSLSTECGCIPPPPPPLWSEIVGVPESLIPLLRPLGPCWHHHLLGLH